MKRRHLEFLLYIVALASGAVLLWQGRSIGLFPPPPPGTDQEAMLRAASELARGVLPGGEYRYSYAYTGFLTLLYMATGGSLFWMRLAQTAVCALAPVLIFRCVRMMKLGKTAAVCGALCYIFYAPALLISVDFLRAGPLALAFCGCFYCLLAAWWKRSRRWLAGAGICAALCVLGRENFAPVILLPLTFWCFPAVRERFGGAAGAGGYLAAALLPVLAVICLNGIRFGSYQPVPGNAANIMAFYHGGAHGAAETCGSLLRSVPEQFRNYLSSYELPNSLSVYAHRELIAFLRIFALPFHVLTLLALAGVWFHRRNRAVQLAALLTAGYAGSLLFFTIFYRFRIPAIPLEAMLAGAGISALLRSVRRREYRTLAVFALCGGGFLWCTDVAPDTKRPFGERAAVSRMMIELERFGEAEAYLAKMAADGHDVRAGALLLARRLYAAGDIAGAQAAAERFLRK